MGNVYFFDEKFRQSTVSDRDTIYVYVEDVAEFKDLCGDNYEWEGVEDVGCYTWSNSSYTWEESTENDRKAITQAVEKIKESTDGTTKAKGDIFVGWNILITLDTGETIKTNSEPISIDEAQEAINILLRPSFFGKRIKKFEIVAE